MQVQFLPLPLIDMSMEFKRFIEAVKISDPDAFEKMTKVEGPNWAKTQKQNPESDFGFFAYKKAWEEIVSSGYEGKASPRELLKGDGAIYGEGGFSRYMVDEHGNIILAKWSTQEDKIKKAEALGFDVK